MTESKIYADNFKCSFGNSDQFLDFLKERKERSLWMKAPSNSLQFKPLEKDTELGSLYMQLYQSNGSAEILVDNTPCFFSIYYEGTLCSNNLYSEEVFECPCTRGKKQPKSLACVSTLWTGCVKNEKSVTTKQDLDAP